MGRHHAVGVHHHHGVGEAVGEDPLEGEGQGVSLARPGSVATHQHARPGPRRGLGGAVATVVGHDQDPDERTRVVQAEQALDGLGDRGLLVVGGNDDVEAEPRRDGRGWKGPSGDGSQERQVS